MVNGDGAGHDRAHSLEPTTLEGQNAGDVRGGSFREDAERAQWCAINLRRNLAIDDCLNDLVSTCLVRPTVDEAKVEGSE